MFAFLSVLTPILLVAAILAVGKLSDLLKRLGELEQRLKRIESRHDAALRRVEALEANLSGAASTDPRQEHSRSDRSSDAIENVSTWMTAQPQGEWIPTASRSPESAPSATNQTAGEPEFIGLGSPERPPRKDRPRSIPAKADEPDWFDPIRRYLSQWNPVVLGGAVLVLLGVVFLLGLAAQNGFFPPSVRLAGATVLAGGLLVAGWRQRLARPAWALPLQGTACAILYFVLYAAYHRLGLIPGGAAFAGAVVVLVSTAVLAVVQSSQRLAVLAMAAGFAAPIVFSTGQGSHVGLFSYYVLLDLGVVAMVWARGWKLLLGLAFVATYGIATTWGVLEFSPDRFASCEAFLWIFYALFGASAVGFALHGDGKRQGVVSGSLVFGLPLVTFSLQAGLVRGDKLLLAWTAAGMCLHHLLVGAWVLKQAAPDRRPALKVMAETLLVLGSILGSVAIPLALSGRWTSLAWAVEGAGLVWLSVRQGRVWNLVLGALLLVGAAFTHFGTRSVVAVDSGVLAVALLVAARCVDLAALPGGARPWAGRAAVLLAWVVVVRGLSGVLRASLPVEDIELWMLSGVAACTAFSSLLHVRFARWPGFHVSWIPSAALWGLLAFNTGMDTGSAVELRFWAFVVAPVAALWSLDLSRRDDAFPGFLRTGIEALFLYGTAFVACTAFARYLESPVWGNALGWTLAALLLGVFTNHRWTAIPWFANRPGLHRGAWLFPWTATLALMSVATLFSRGDSSPLPWIPVLNSADLPVMAFLVVLVGLPKSVVSWGNPVSDTGTRKFVAALVFAWATSTLFRAFHAYGAVEWSLDAIFDSRALQSAWSLLLTAQALGLCWFASKRGRRSLWFTGAALLGFVVLKLMVVDLSGTGSVARIVSFLGAGLLMVGIGYVSPVPPSKGTA